MTKNLQIKTCKYCKKSKPWDQFNRADNTRGGLSNKCKECKKEWSQTHPQIVRVGAKIWRDKNKPRLMFYNAKARAEKRNTPFNITVEDIVSVWPDSNRCPVLGIPFVFGIGKQGPASPTLDAFNPDLGYVVGNISVISNRANAIKQRETTGIPFQLMAAWIDKRNSVR